MGSLRTLRRTGNLEDTFQAYPPNTPNPKQLGKDLLSACRSNEWKEAEVLLHKGADPNFLDPTFPSTILGHALRCDAPISLIKLLLQKGGDVNKSPKALLQTCGRHQVGKTELLLKYGADPNVRDAQGWTPLMTSLSRNWTRFIEPLVKYGADLDAVDNRGRTALMVAIELKNSHALSPLLECGADPYIKDRDGKTAMDLGTKWWAVQAFERAGIEV